MVYYGICSALVLTTLSSGLLSFASTTFILSLYNVSARGVQKPNAVVGMALGCGGLAQFLAGMWEFPRGNTFGATGKSSLSLSSMLGPRGAPQFDLG